MAIENPDELRDRVKECVENFAETVDDEQDFTPKIFVAHGEQWDRDEKPIDQPSKILTFYSSRQEEFFEETAEWLHDSGNGYPLERIERDDDIPVVDLGAVLEEKDPEFVKPESDGPNLFSYVNTLFNFAGTVMDYSGGYFVTDEGFETAYEQHWLPNYDTGLSNFEVIVPLYSFFLPDGEEIELSTDFKLQLSQYNFYRVDSLRICPLEEDEKLGVHTYAGFGTPIEVCEYKIHAKIASREDDATLYYPGEEIAERVATALRLFKSEPDAGDLTVGSSYRWEPNWLEFREGVPDFRWASDVNKDRDQRQDPYDLDSDNLEEFTDFWKDHCQRMRIDENGVFSRSIQRYNEIWSKRFYEDQLLDCLIGLEGLLLQGTTSSGSITLRLKLRGGQLLDHKLPYERGYIHNFLQDIYTIRGGIVHENKYLADVLTGNTRLKVVDGKFDHPIEVIKEARYFMGEAIVAYMDISEKTGMSMAEIGKEMDKAALNADTSNLFD